MAKKKHNRKPGGAAAGGSGTGPAGRELDPNSLPEGAAPEAAQPGAVPLGLPISPKAYEELQRKARHQAPPPSGRAQEDPSASSEGG
jgi:hypothetical protein